MLTDKKSAMSPPECDPVVGRLGSLRRQGPETKIPSLCDLVRNVVIVASSSRGGSSVFAEILRRCDAFLHFRAEINAILHINGLIYPFTQSGSDALSAEHLTPKVRLALDQDLSLDCGNPQLGRLSPSEIDSYALAVARRLTIQWPHHTFNYDLTKQWILSTFDVLKKSFGWTKREVRDPQLFWCIFLTHACTEFPDINPYFYDMNPQLIKNHFPYISLPKGPPPSRLIEEPPFIIPVPLKAPTRDLMVRKALVIKTSSNVYRLGFLTSLFPNATPWILHLTRNAPHAINGLYDGWCYHGFFSYYMPGKLNIPGYTDRFPAWGKDWWHFDLPPGWQDYTSKPLAEVCAFQWHSAHSATLDHMRMNPQVNYLRIKSEDVLSPSELTRKATAEKIGRWLGWDSTDSLSDAFIRRMEPVMATKPPRPDRWREKFEIIAPIVARENIKKMAEELGYPPIAK